MKNGNNTLMNRLISQDLILFLFENNAIRIGDFTLSSGKKSMFYIDLRILQSYPPFFRKAIFLLKSLIIFKFGIEQFDYICSIPTSGTIFGSSLSYEIFKPHIYVRKSVKNYGTKKSIEGDLVPGTRVLFIDDVITTGQSLLTSIDLLKDKVKITGISVLIDRSQGSKEVFNKLGLTFQPAITIADIIDILNKNGKISKEIASKMSNEIS